MGGEREREQEDEDEEIGGCGHEGKQEPPHPCPYRTDVDDDYLTLCTCCEDCQDSCAGDV